LYKDKQNSNKSSNSLLELKKLKQSFRQALDKSRQLMLDKPQSSGLEVLEQALWFLLHQYLIYWAKRLQKWDTVGQTVDTICKTENVFWNGA